MLNKTHVLVVGLIILTLFLSSAYLILGPVSGPKGLEFLGRHNINSQDTYTYLSFIDQARHGALLFKNLYTPEVQPAVFFHPAYLAAGWLANIFNLSNIAAFHLTRIIIGAAFLLVAWKFLGNVPAFAMLCLSSGFLADPWIPEANTFLTLADSPHLIFSQLLVMGIFGFFLAKKPWLAGLLMLILAFDHPFDVPVIILALGFYWWVKRQELKSIILTVMPAVAGLGYYFWAMKTYPAIAAWNAQNNLLSPDFYYFILGYGLLWILAALGIKRAFVHNERKALILLCWIFASVVLLYSPLGPQRRFVSGLHIPIVILAGYGVTVILEKVITYFNQLKWNPKVVAAVFTTLLVVIFFGSNGFAIYQDWKLFRADKIDNYYYYLPPSELAAINWLKNNTSPEAIVGTNWFYGNVIPGLTGRRVFLGHRIQTVDPDAKIKEIGEFVNSDTDQQAKDFLKKWGINYFFFGVGDSLLRGNFKPEEKPYFQKVYDKDGDRIYKVK